MARPDLTLVPAAVGELRDHEQQLRGRWQEVSRLADVML
jgi:hypothetical protein